MYVHFCSNTPEAMTTDAPAKTEKGWTAVKTVPVALTRILDGSPLFKAAEAGLRATREARSDDTDILLDLPCHLTPQMAIQYGKFFEDYHPLFLEEPTQAEKPRAMARALTTPIATGEHPIHLLGLPRDPRRRGR